MKVIFEFVGGCLDGKSYIHGYGKLCGHATMLYNQSTDKGRIGAVFGVMSDYVTENLVPLLARDDAGKLAELKLLQSTFHPYRVTDCLKVQDGDEEEVMVRADAIIDEAEVAECKIEHIAILVNPRPILCYYDENGVVVSDLDVEQVNEEADTVVSRCVHPTAYEREKEISVTLQIYRNLGISDASLKAIEKRTRERLIELQYD